MNQKLNFITGLGVAALLMGSMAGAQEVITEGPFTVTFSEGRLNIDETKALPGACTGANDTLTSVKLDYAVRTKADYRATNNTSGDPDSFTVRLFENPLNLFVGGSDVIASDPKGELVQTDDELESGETLTAAADPLTDIDNTTTITSNLTAFESGASVNFVAKGRTIKEGPSNLDEEVNHFGQASVSATYTCSREVCEFNPNLPPDSPLCFEACPYNPSIPIDDPNCFEKCPYNPSIPVDDPNCAPPPPVPGMTSFGLVASLLGLPLIAGFFAARRRMKK